VENSCQFFREHFPAVCFNWATCWPPPRSLHGTVRVYPFILRGRVPASLPPEDPLAALIEKAQGHAPLDDDEAVTLALEATNEVRKKVSSSR
jgi:hypothetical protein